jgi:Fe-S cluster biosynthesis and repair protein YggX
MPRTVFCQKLNREAAGLEYAPYPGALGQRIFENISREAWEQWLSHLAILLNDYRLNSADPEAVAFIEQHMVGFLFGEGEFGGPAASFRPPSRKK